MIYVFFDSSEPRYKIRVSKLQSDKLYFNLVYALFYIQTIADFRISRQKYFHTINKRCIQLLL